MTALWIVLAVLAALVLVGLTTVALRRRGARPPVVEPPTRPVAEPTPPDAVPETAEAPPAVAEAPAGEAPAGEAPPVEAPPVEAPVEEVAAPPSFRARLGKARGVFSGLRALRGRGSVDQAVWDDLEESLLRADVGVATTDAVLGSLRQRVETGEIRGGEELLDGLRRELLASLVLPVPDGGATGRELELAEGDGVVNVWLFVGVNGVGKTTTVGKVARRETTAGRSVLLAAGDTFRAAAGEQLAMWAERTGSEIVRGAEGGDPSAIVFDAVQRAAARGNDLVLADTAGRLHTKVNLVEELKKIRRVADRPPGQVSEVLLVLDATTGQNAVVQAKQFTDAVAVTGVVLTKLDGTAKGGVVLAVQRELGLPVKLVGLGEGPDDLVPFDPEEFVDALLAS